MNTSNLKITEKCIKCGSCLGCGYEFLTSTDDGSIAVKNGTVIDETSAEFKTLQDICPVGAFEIDSSKLEDPNQIIKKLVNELRQHKGIDAPTLKDLAFKKEEYSIDMPYGSGQNMYEYSSDSAAERAALNEFERVMYSKIDVILLKIITEYRVKHVKPYYTAELNEGSVYAKNNKYIEGILETIVSLSKGKLPLDFAKVNIFPSNQMDWKMLNRGEIVADECISAIRSEFDYPSSQYSCYWETDYTEFSEMGFWGNKKYTEKYCYSNLNAAFRELSKDLLNACGWAHERMENQALQSSGWLVQEYNKELKTVIDEKISQIESIVL